ncbi:MAG: hypothetical protein QXZ20_00715, partial [Candidatus Aenigmatarchaeota archaeon]
MKSFKENIFAFFIYFLISVTVFSPFLFFSKTFIPVDLQNWILPWANQQKLLDIKNHYLLDVIGEHYPWKYLFKENIKKGIFVLWNPYNFWGIPQISTSTPCYLDIFNIVYLFFPYNSLKPDALIVFLKILFSGFFMFLLLRFYKISYLSSILGGISFMFCGSFINMHTFYWTLGAFLWVPLIILFLEKSLYEKKFLGFAGLAFGFSHLGGNLQTTLQIFLLFFLWVLGKILFFKSNSRKIIFNVTFSYLLGILVAAVAIFPVIELFFVGCGRYYLFSLWIKNFFYNFLKIPLLISFAIPHFFGHHSIYSIVSIFKDKWSDYLMGYSGFIPFILACLASIKIKIRQVKLYTFIAVATTFLILFTPLVIIIYFRAFVIFCFCVALLSGFGLDYLKNDNFFVHKLKKNIFLFFLILIIGLSIISLITNIFKETIRLKAYQYFNKNFVFLNPVFGFTLPFYLKKIDSTLAYYSFLNPLLIFTLLLIFAFFVLLYLLEKERISKKIFSFIIVFLVLIDMISFFYFYIPIIDTKIPLYPQNDVSSFLNNDKELYRIITLSKEGMDPPIYHYESNIAHHIQKLGGDGSLNYKRTLDFFSYFNLDKVNFDSKIANLSNVKYILTKSISLPSPYILVYSGSVNIYKNPNYLPRAFLVKKFSVLEPKKILERMKEESFNPEVEVILEKSPSVVLSETLLEEKKILFLN